MIYDLQKASMWKRISAWMLDGILISVLAVALALTLSAVLQYDRYVDGINTAFDRYEELYGIDFEVSTEDYNSWSDEQRQAYDAAYEKVQEAMLADEEAIHNYNMATNLAMIIVTASLLLSLIALEFVVPLFLKNGQTLGKKVFGLCVVRKDCVEVNSLQLFARTVVGKFTVETMIPVYILFMLFFGAAGLMGIGILLALGLAQIICIIVTRSNAALHDLLAGTAVADLSGQMIFESTEEMLAFKQQIDAERAARKAEYEE